MPNENRASAGTVADTEVISDTPAAALALIPSDVSDALIMRREPTAVLAEASKAASALMQVMNGKKDKVMMGTEQYIEHEDWLTIGHFYGVTAKLEHDEFVQYGDAEGWEATAILIARDGRELGRATAMCLNDEEKWSTRPKFEWCQEIKPTHAAQYGEFTRDGKSYARRSMNAPTDALVWEKTEQDDPNRPGEKKSRPASARFQVSEEKVPSFQLRSMAQTRASAKVHRMILGFVPVLAGFSPTPAEEMADNTERVPNTPKGKTTVVPPANGNGTAARQAGSSSTTTASQPKPASAPAADGGGTKATKLVTEPQVRRLWSIVTEQNFSEDAVVTRIREKYQHTATNQLTMAEYDELVNWIKAGGDAGVREPGAEG